jgi:multidrug efflux pump subunit AcrB
MNGFNLSDWALSHRSFVWFLMIVSIFAGTMSYMSIGREEDPNFAIKTMIVMASLPGADVEQALSQVTDRIEKKLEELPELDYTRSLQVNLLFTLSFWPQLMPLSCLVFGSGFAV